MNIFGKASIRSGLAPCDIESMCLDGVPGLLQASTDKGPGIHPDHGLFEFIHGVCDDDWFPGILASIHLDVEVGRVL